MIPTKAMTPHVPVVAGGGGRSGLPGAGPRRGDRAPARPRGRRHADVPGPDLRGDDPRHPGRASRRDHLRELQRAELPRVRAAERGARADRRGASRPGEPHPHQPRFPHRHQPERAGHGDRAGREDGGAGDQAGARVLRLRDDQRRQHADRRRACWASRRTTSTCCSARATRCPPRRGTCPACWRICRPTRSGRPPASGCSSCR